MKVPSDQIPQADRLTDVIKTVIAVSQGARSYQDLARAIGKVDRQGRYYRKAAEIIGLIRSTGRNHSALTDLGRQFVQTDPTLSNPVLFQGVLNSRIFQRIIPFLENNAEKGATRDEIKQFLINTADLGGPTMAPRRISSVISWLVDLNIVTEANDRYHLSTTTINERVESVAFDNVDEPLIPSATDLSEYETVQMRSKEAEETIISYKRSAATERADNSHRRLVNLTSERIRIAGSLPKYNQLIDLATRYQNQDFIFEMKSTTEKNEKTQIRNGLSQLYEYRYLQNKPSAKLVLVIENPLSHKESWRSDYLEKDRDVYLIWDGNDQLYGNERTRNDLDFLNITK
tara:strand:+ start:11659 stop:12693 length:1035 start_codon:yes stop_codon:yes gene_type:complete